MTGPTSSCEFPSEMSLLVDACIRQVRETAGLDEDAVLPPLPVIAPRREVAIFAKSETGPAVSRPREIGGGVTTVRVPRRGGGGGSRAALLLCALVASGFACAAFLASPMGKRPAVVAAVHAARAHANHAAYVVGVVPKERPASVAPVAPVAAGARNPDQSRP